MPYQRLTRVVKFPPDPKPTEETKMKPGKRVRGAFNQGVIPTIACFNKATIPMSKWGVDLDALIAAMQVYVDSHVAPVWGTPAKLIKSKDFVKKAWAIVFLDS